MTLNGREVFAPARLSPWYVLLSPKVRLNLKSNLIPAQTKASILRNSSKLRLLPIAMPAFKWPHALIAVGYPSCHKIAPCRKRATVIDPLSRHGYSTARHVG